MLSLAEDDILPVEVPDMVEPQRSLTREMAALLDERQEAGWETHFLGPGYPDETTFDTVAEEAHAAAYFEVQARTEGVSLSQYLSGRSQYTDTNGPKQTREVFAAVHGGDIGVEMKARHVVPTIGASGAIDTLCAAFAALGIPIAYLCDRPTYTGFPTRALRDRRHAALYSIRMDKEGPLPDDFRRQILKARNDGRVVAFYYTGSIGNNPTGLTFSERRMREILAIAYELRVLIVDDHPYSYIQFDGKENRPFLSYDEHGVVVHIFTASKVWNPANRIGMMYTRAKIAEGRGGLSDLSKILVNTSASSFLMHGPAPLRRFEAFLHGPDMKPQSLWTPAKRKIEIYKRGRDALFAGLQTYLGETGLEFDLPAAGFFIVVTDPQRRLRVDSDFIKWLLKEHGISVIPMFGFYPADARAEDPEIGMNQMRLAFSYKVDDIHVAVEHLGEVLRPILGYPQLPRR